MLASDLNNREFVNPQNPDSLLSVEFYWFSPVDKYASETEGKEIRRAKIPFVRIMKPGDNTSILETAVREDHKRRWPDKWLYWQMKEGLISGEGEVPGWKLDEWTELEEEQKRELKFLRFSVVEQIAGASDSQVQRMGMGGNALREKAKIALRARMGAETKAEIQKKDAEIFSLNARLAKLEELLTAPRVEVAPSVPSPSAEATQLPPIKHKRRPKGSKNKPKEAKEAKEATA